MNILELAKQKLKEQEEKKILEEKKVTVPEPEKKRKKRIAIKRKISNTEIKRWKMSIKHILCFVELCSKESYTIAAKELMISQSTLSYVIKELEKELGCSLIHRTCREFKITKQGEYFLLVAYEINALLEQFIKNSQI